MRETIEALQTFPADYDFRGTSEQVRWQIGMAVLTEGARQIFTAILKTFAKVPYDVDAEADALRVYPASSSRWRARNFSAKLRRSCPILQRLSVLPRFLV